MGFSDEDLKEGHRKRLRERYYRSDLKSFKDYEVLELLLTYAIPRIDVKPLAKQLLIRFGSLRKVLDAAPFELLSIPGMGPSSVGLFRLFKDTCSRYLEESIRTGNMLDNMDKLSDFLRMKIGGSYREQFVALYLDTHNHLIAFHLFPGTVNRNNVPLREIVSQCLRCEASNLIVAHNHPSGSLEPSREDILFSCKLKMLLKTLEITLQDHLIIAGNRCHSIMPLVEMAEKSNTGMYEPDI
ncbi:MAG: DNA repair protein RadC [Lentisphaeria bacterium]|nr:DNA repair protein RadC [Lentisphaeria bacterium]